MEPDSSVSLGPMDDCLRREYPIIGDRAFGGGRCMHALRRLRRRFPISDAWRMGLDSSVTLGPIDDCLHGEDPRVVLIGDRALGGGR